VKPIIDENKLYTFHKYFELNPPLDELLAYFGYHHNRVEKYPLPHQTVDQIFFASLKTDLLNNILYTDLTSETARRESLIAPILFKIAAYLKTSLRIEYPLRVNKQLGGKLDYYMRQANNLLIIEAKQGDLQRGFTQLAVELIALDKWLEDAMPLLYGCLSLGNIWQFVVLDRQTKQITEDLKLYDIPNELDSLLGILIGILTTESKP
jgi:hypothetical protein